VIARSSSQQFSLKV